MKRSEINQLIVSARNCFEQHGWTLPPRPRWDVTDFGLGDWKASALVLVNLAEHAEYCEKLMYAREKMVTPAHCHHKKKEDIISRWGTLRVQVWPGVPGDKLPDQFELLVNNEKRTVAAGAEIDLTAGERITLVPHVYHLFYPVTAECIIGEVSTANDDANDNFFIDPNIGRYPQVEEDEPAILKLLSDPA
jgi:hypothetical protein